MATNSARPEPPLVVIVGPTASGKTGLAIELARRVGGEIICADSRTVYRGMDIGTAKPTAAERAAVQHWGLDLVAPGERFTAADFKAYATSKIAEIRARGRVPFLVGGTGLYIDAVLLDYQFGAVADESVRARFNAMTVGELQKYCEENNIKLPENAYNKRYLVRVVEQNGVNNRRNTHVQKNTIVVGIATNNEVLRQRIAARTEQLFADGVVDEAKLLGKKYGWDSEAMTANIYPLLHQYIDGGLSLSATKERFATLDWRLAKRQRTWLKRRDYITWLSLDEARRYLKDKIAHL